MKSKQLKNSGINADGTFNGLDRHLAYINEVTMRTKISENNIFPKFSAYEEYGKLNSLFAEKPAFGIWNTSFNVRMPSISYQKILSTIFLQWKLRGAFTSLGEMLASLKISENDFIGFVINPNSESSIPISVRQQDDEEEKGRLLDYVQFLLNAIDFVFHYVEESSQWEEQDQSVRVAIIKNCEMIMDRLGAEALIDKDSNEHFIVYKDEVGTVVANQNPELEGSIVEYQKIDNRHDLTRKAEILCTISKKLEERESIFKGSSFKSAFDNFNIIANTAGIRHAQDDKQPIDLNFSKMNADEKEKWYDRAFQIALACFALIPYIEFLPELNELKKDKK